MLSLPAPTFKPYRVFSSGWGTQSVAALVLQAQGKLPKPYDAFVFANVGEDSENPETLAYYKEHVIPFAAKHNIAIVERQKMWRGKPDTVYQATMRDNRSIPVPIVFPDRGFGNRTCTRDFKILVVQKYLATEVSPKPTHVEMGIGFTRDEVQRIYKKYPGWHNYAFARDKKGKWKRKMKIPYWQLYEYPLVSLGLTRMQCSQIVVDAGLPPPPKSACWFCMFTGRSVWIDRKRNKSPLFDKAIQFEIDVNKKYAAIRQGSPHKSGFVAVHRDGMPLAKVPDQTSLWDTFMDQDEEDHCEVGVCDV